MAAQVTLATVPAEKGHIVIDATFADENSASVIPNAITWTLTDKLGAVINSRNQVAVSTPATTVTILVSGDDLAISTYGATDRRLLIEWAYNSSLGNDIPDKVEVRFNIADLVAVK